MHQIAYEDALKTCPISHLKSCPNCSLLDVCRGRSDFAFLRPLPSHVIESRVWRYVLWLDRGHSSRAHLAPRTKVSSSCFQPSQMKFLQQFISKKNSKQSSSKRVPSSSTELESLQAAVALLETEPPKISLDNVADNLPQVDDNTLLCILQALTSPIALTSARLVSLHVNPRRLPHRLITSSSDLQAPIRIWGCKGSMDALGSRAVPTGAAARLA